MKQPHPLIPQVIYAHSEEETTEQVVLCVKCGPASTPAKIMYISGTSFCVEHAATRIPE